MKKISSIPRVTGRMDSLTDVLKQLLFQYEPQGLEELVPSVRSYLSLQHSPARLEKDILRCLEKNPAFEETDRGLWSLNLRGLRENDGAYQVIKKEGRPMRLAEISESMRNGRQTTPEEKRLVRDGRFLRLKGGQWVLVPWEVIRAVQPKEMDQIAKMLGQSEEPQPIAQISEKILKVGWRETNLLQCLEEDPRFVWVGGSLWYLQAKIPHLELPPAQTPFAFLEEGETGALQGAELMLTFQDTDPNRRSYILSSRDLRFGVLRLNKRLEKLFISLPPVAFIKFKTPAGPCGAWYYREAQIVGGLGSWLDTQDVSPGSKLEIRRSQEGEEIVFQLMSTGEREAEVFAEAKRVEKIAGLENEELATWSLEELLAAILSIFPEGLGEEMLLKVLGLLRPEAISGLLTTLNQFPFFEEISPGTWYFNSSMKQAFDDLQNQVRQTRGMLEEQRAEVAATKEEARTLTVLKRNLEGELEARKGIVQELEEQLDATQARCYELEREKEELRAGMEKLVRRKDQLRAELTQSSEETSNLQAEKEALECRIEQLENRVLQLQGSYNKTLGKSQAEHAALKQRLSDTEKRLQGALVANQELQKILAQLQEERLEMKRCLRLWPVRLAIAMSRWLGFSRRLVVES